jgi:DNA-binding NtrC family response regulator
MPTLLIVDDDAAIRGTLWELFSDKYECNTASTAEEAIEFLEIETYDAVITDIAMPGLDGLDLMKRIQLKDLPVPVILISGKGQEHDSESLIKLGAFAYVTKPFRLEQIEEVVKAATEGNGKDRSQ